jgi:nucleoside-diphosphate-sugar epimerase
MTLRKRNVWVLGGTGFIGKALIQQLSHNPNNLVHLLVHKHVPYRVLESYNVFSGSLESFEAAWFEKYPPDILFHLARIGGGNAITRSWAARRGAKANKRLLGILKNLPAPPVVVYVSGSLMYGNQPERMVADESTPLSPVSYARYYVEAERPWLQAQKEQLLDIRFARPGWILGAGSWWTTFYWNPFMQTGNIPLYGDGEQRMSLVDVDDCARQIVLLAERGAKYQNLNIFSGLPVTQRIFAATLAGLLRAGVERIPARQLEKTFGRTVTEALCSSIPLTSQYPDLVEAGYAEFPDLEAMFQKVLLALKYQ